MRGIIFFLAGSLTGIVILLCLSIVGIIPTVVSSAEYKLSQSLHATRVFIDGKPYVVFIGFEGGSNSYRGDAALVSSMGKCAIRINRVTHSYLQNSGNFSYIFPEKEKCSNIR